MELPVGTEGRKATHDFLSLYSSSAAHNQQDPSPSQGGYLKTHDFLQPLERVGKHVTTTKEDIKAGVAAVDRPPAPAPPASVEHLLPGGIGTYSISYFNQLVLKPEGSLFTAQPTRNDENSNCSSYSGGSFTLWDESAVKKGKTGKENIATERHILQEAGVNVVGGQWAPFLEKPSQSSSNHKHNTTNFSTFSSSQPSSSQKNQSFMDVMTSAKNDQEDDDDDEEEEEFTIKKEPSPHSKGNLSVKVEAKTIDQKPNTPRSKHSATEQRRRSKINDRFQRLREIIPNSEQKRDKASFLLEVIEYIQFLQEKVNRYDSSYNIWNHEPAKMMQWRNCHVSEGFVERARGTSSDSAPASVFGKKFDESKAAVSPSLPISGQNLVDSDLSTATTLRERVVQLPESTSKAATIHSPMQPNIFTLGGRTTSIPASPISPKQASDLEKAMTWPPSQLRSCTTDTKMTEHELTIESGTINISSVYSQGLLNTLTQALQSSGVDLSQASISVQIDLGKKANGVTHSSTFISKEDEVDTTLPRSATASTGKEFGRAAKKLRTS
ncbi:transcription factor BIM1 isoform X2 [Salvia miltiorrhiza]|uniref:transcription factor BIM1 isoform X2 n=1 Tax=Salvia miltiorrhiza TaxID=226208 RepID=UPI0025ACF2BA|nr:transcription factor BIM1 isoform X2 [Salvia miltiorrhiza]XP_057791662.1 transcription factor BIM1 isoform X2 [Salvia miltiorrhiza]XP_057791663.1 transcription factor BIM1 isoform X2 [Salvia miltiorrhiza]XP_057791664.1 transcription factor BIM1 isoform X2 [Salvia miltiorrhiza]